ncbi:MAG: hypothetical protein Q9220_005728 [cf. Caloplaca sp. 1 TL-2023]
MERKRQREPDVEWSSKRRREVEPVRALSQANLEEHNRQTESESSIGRAKRTLSRRTSTAERSQDATTVSSLKSSTGANYRWINLDSARVYAENQPVPQHIHTLVDAIIQHTVSPDKEKELSAITNTLCKDLVRVMKNARGRDDSVIPIYTALKALDSGGKLAFSRKSDWNTSLEPIVKSSVWHFNLPESPPKPRHAAPAYISPEKSECTLPPPPSIPSTSSEPPKPPHLALPNQDISIVKTPRSDITIGLRDTLVIEKLKEKGFRGLEASDFLKALQYQQVLSNPLQQQYSIFFPPLVVEGKSYSTGRSVFEAQNQAAVSGSCMTNLQHQLADLSKRTSPESSSRSQEPLAFSICTEGPMMQLWVHYTTLTDDERLYHMNILRICHASTQPFLQEGVRDFLKAVYGVMKWAISDFLDGIVGHLGLIWNAGRQQS